MDDDSLPKSHPLWGETALTTGCTEKVAQTKRRLHRRYLEVQAVIKAMPEPPGGQAVGQLASLQSGATVDWEALPGLCDPCRAIVERSSSDRVDRSRLHSRGLRKRWQVMPRLRLRTNTRSVSRTSPRCLIPESGAAKRAALSSLRLCLSLPLIARHTGVAGGELRHHSGSSGGRQLAAADRGLWLQQRRADAAAGGALPWMPVHR